MKVNGECYGNFPIDHTDIIHIHALHRTYVRTCINLVETSQAKPNKYMTIIIIILILSALFSSGMCQFPDAPAQLDMMSASVYFFHPKFGIGIREFLRFISAALF